MKRRELEHLIRTAADIADDDEIIVIGSQAILGAYPDAPEALRVSMEADLYLPVDEARRAIVLSRLRADLAASR